MERLAVGILLFDDVEVLDFAGPFEVFSRTRLEPGAASRRSEDSAPFDVFTIARRKEPVRATGGLIVTPHHAFAEEPTIDILVVPGGYGTRALLDDRETVDWIRRQAGRSQITCSVCTGSLLLARAGLLEGRRATTHWGALDLLERLGDIAVERKQRVVDDGIVTSAGVASGMDMSLALVARLHGEGVAEETAKYIEHHRAATVV